MKLEWQEVDCERPDPYLDWEFRTRHEEADFFEPAAVVKGIGRLGMAGRQSDFGMWYLVEAKKRPSARRRPPRARAGRAKPRAAR